MRIDTGIGTLLRQFIRTTTRSRGVERRKAKQNNGKRNPRHISSLLLPSLIVDGDGGRVGECSGFVHSAIVMEESQVEVLYFMVRSFELATFEEKLILW